MAYLAGEINAQQFRGFCTLGSLHAKPFTSRTELRRDQCQAQRPKLRVPSRPANGGAHERLSQLTLVDSRLDVPFVNTSTSTTNASSTQVMANKADGAFPPSEISGACPQSNDIVRNQKRRGLAGSFVRSITIRNVRRPKFGSVSQQQGVLGRQQ